MINLFSLQVKWKICSNSISIIKDYLSLAHCFPKRETPNVVRLGDQNLNDAVRDNAQPVTIGISAVINHPEYSRKYKYNDISLVELNNRVRWDIYAILTALDINALNLKFKTFMFIVFSIIFIFKIFRAFSFTTFIRPACLAQENQSVKDVTATGWGLLDGNDRNSRSDDLQKVSLQVLSNQQCNSYYSNLGFEIESLRNGIISTQFCAGNLEGGVLKGGRDTCEGDSGNFKICFSTIALLSYW